MIPRKKRKATSPAVLWIPFAAIEQHPCAQSNGKRSKRVSIDDSNVAHSGRASDRTTYPGEHQSGKKDTRTRAREEHVGRHFGEEVALKNPAREIVPSVMVTESKPTNPRDSN
jgi:hypothetical protein